jgi:hypothetical protein
MTRNSRNKITKLIMILKKQIVQASKNSKFFENIIELQDVDIKIDKKYKIILKNKKQTNHNNYRNNEWQGALKTDIMKGDERQGF